MTNSNELNTCFDNEHCTLVFVRYYTFERSCIDRPTWMGLTISGPKKLFQFCKSVEYSSNNPHCTVSSPH